MDGKKIEKIWEELIQEIGFSLTDENFRETPKRVARLYGELFEGINCKDKVKKILDKAFPTKYTGMVVETNIKCYSMCPHHFLPVIYSVHVGYIPRGDGLGLSKLPRLIKLLARAPKLQEDFTEEIVDIIQNTINPLGVICVVNGEHLCMQSRGAEQRDCLTITSGVRGCFDTNDKNCKEEFFKLINLK
jgi:GTP cyclohydrolase I